MLRSKNRICDRVTDLNGITVVMLFLALTATISLQSVHASQDSDSSLTALAQQVIVDKSDEVMAISMDIMDMPLHEALEILTEEIGVGLSYSSDITLDKKVTLRMSNVPFHEVLYALLEGTNLEPVLPPTKDVLVIREKGTAEVQELFQETVRGTVVDAQTGDPLPGVNIIISGTASGTASDVNGNYELPVSSLSDSLIFSYIGYQRQEIPIEGRTEIDVILQIQFGQLDDLVVLGYSTRTQREISSSMQTVTADELTDVTSADVLSQLRGKAAGIYITSASGQPGTAASIRIRGTGSITASSEPLYVIDGLIGNVNDVSPNDVETVTILKDADATSLYGSRGSNGVVLITTKRGRAGETNINLNVNMGFTDMISGDFKLMNSAQLYELHSSVVNVPESYLQHDTDWVSHGFQRGLTSNYAISAASGSENTRFYISGNYYSEDGVLVSTGYDRFSGRINIEHDLSDRFRIIARLSGNNATRNNEGSGTDAIRDIYLNMPWDYPYNEDGSIRRGTEPDWIGQDRRNFLHDYAYNWHDVKTHGYQGDLRMEFEINNWLSVSSSNRVGFNYIIDEAYLDPNTRPGGGSGGRVNKSILHSNSMLTSNLLNVNRDFGVHNVGGLVGFEYIKNFTENVSGSAVGGSSGLSIIDTMASPLDIGGSVSESAFTSGLLQGFYNYRNKYSATASMRIDGSSRFGIDNRYGNFYSIGASWILSNENFFNVTAINLLKFRTSYGTTGNAEVGDYVAQGLYSFDIQYGGNPGGLPGRLPNPGLTWEVAREINFGMDMALLERIELSVDVYQKDNEDLLQNVPLEAVAGITSVIRNVGSVRNRGLEINLSTVNTRGRLNWTTDLNIGFNRNTVLELHGGEPIILSNRRIMEGENLDTWYMRKWAGVNPDNGDPLWEQLTYDEQGNVINITLTNVYNDASLQPVGTATPDFIGGIRNTLQYEGFSLGLFINFVYGNQIRYANKWIFDNDGAYMGRPQRVLSSNESRWQQPGDVATHPRFVAGGNLNSDRESSRLLEDGSYLRLQNITFSYELPRNILQNLSLRSTRVYISGDNLLTLTNYTGMDPAVGPNATDSSRYPTSKKIMFGINIGI